ncbi:helix-turn-helix domain-containing protein [Caulobacter sp. S45]|uniref:helix-turn-helix domain-containing protein n=1 Tax=Caulobacter sp. S45 TaxID=1641861 RepID=UPI0020B132FC|nr:helix-turn-helix transcriptional regulator [Caulobacter sp. S45]
MGIQVGDINESSPTVADGSSRAGPDPIDIEVGLTIRRLRTSQGKSQATLGSAIGLTFQQVQKYERGANRISASMLVRVAKALDVQPADLLPTTDAPRLPPAIRHFAWVHGTDELVAGYAAIKSIRHRRAVLVLVRNLMDEGPQEDREPQA